MSFDLPIFNGINGLAKKSRVLDFFAVLFAVYVGPLMFFILAGISFVRNDIEIFIAPFCSALIARFVLNEAIYHLYQRKRPLEVLNIRYLIKKPNHPSFPSGHAAALFALSFGLMPYSMALAGIFLLLSFMIAISRIFCGVHWPSDILMGILLGFVSFFIVDIIRVVVLQNIV